MARGEKRSLLLEVVQVYAPADLTSEEARQFVEKWSEEWPEITDFIRKAATRVSHKLEVRFGGHGDAEN